MWCSLSILALERSGKLVVKSPFFPVVEWKKQRSFLHNLRAQLSNRESAVLFGISWQACGGEDVLFLLCCIPQWCMKCFGTLVLLSFTFADYASLYPAIHPISVFHPFNVIQWGQWHHVPITCDSRVSNIVDASPFLRHNCVFFFCMCYHEWRSAGIL